MLDPVTRPQVEQAILRARDHLLGLQHPEGYWVGELEADVSVSAGYIPLMYFMHGRVDAERQRKVVNLLRQKQQLDGGWSMYAGGPSDLNVSLQVYLALKLAGLPASEPCMQRARRVILSQGGIGQANVFTKIWLALFGQFDWRGVPTVPPEIILLPNRFYFNMYEFASWSRETIMALAVVLTQKPVCRVPDAAQISELYVEPEGERNYAVGTAERFFSWKNLFLGADALFKAWERLPVKPGRARALRETVQWIVEHQERDGSWGGIMLPWVYSLIALKSLGYPLDDPVMRRGLEGLEDFIVQDESTLRLQPATSPVWDTAWAVLALRESGLPADEPALQKAAHWLLGQEIRVAGDWRFKNPRTEPGGWSFEFANDQYPDLDDTAVVPRALSRVQLDDAGERAKAAAIDRARRWIVEMQSRDGGWAAFDRDNDLQILSQVPFADFMSPLDPTCPDVTAHALECLTELGDIKGARSRGLDYIRRSQESDGAWYGRWGVNYIYGTGLALESLAGTETESGMVQRAVRWLAAHQNPDGGWGETCASYADPSCRGVGASTASQTAWALLGLWGAGATSHPAAQAGLAYLLQTQRSDGTWEEQVYTGTGFPKAFYLRYDLYRLYFPLMALARYGK